MNKLYFVFVLIAAGMGFTRPTSQLWPVPNSWAKISGIRTHDFNLTRLPSPKPSLSDRLSRCFGKGVSNQGN